MRWMNGWVGGWMMSGWMVEERQIRTVVRVSADGYVRG